MGAAAAIGGAIISGSASKKAAKSQAAAAQQDLAFQRETRDLARSDLAPWREGGQDAQAALDFELGLRGRPTFGGSTPSVESYYEAPNPNARPVANINSLIGGMAGLPQGSTGGNRGTQRFRVNGQSFATREEAEAFARSNGTGGTEYGGYQKTPGYDFRMKTGMDALESSAAARGGLLSGAAMKASQQFGQDYGSNEYSNYLARLSGRADSGMSAAAGQASAAQTAASGVSNALGNYGDAKAAGAIGVGNALTGGLQNYATWKYMNKSMGQPGGGGLNVGGNLFGGNSWG
jgi:hypothetical protein